MNVWVVKSSTKDGTWTQEWNIQLYASTGAVWARLSKLEV